MTETVFASLLALFGAVNVAAGALLIHGRRSLWSGCALVLGGSLFLLFTALAALGGVPSLAIPIAGGWSLALALALYPTARWRHPLSFVVLVVVFGTGVVAVLWYDAAGGMGDIAFFALVVHVWWTLERGDAFEKRAMTWAALAWLAGGVAVGFSTFLFEALNVGGWSALIIGVVCLLAGPVAMVIGVWRQDAVDVRGLVTSTLVTATVFFTFVAVAIGVTSIAELLIGTPLGVTPVVIICAALAFGVQPLRVVLRGVIDQLLFGDRPNPLTAATNLADRMGDDAAVALDAVREALVLPYAAIEVDGELIASSGTAVTHTRELPLRLGEGATGSITVGLRAGDLTLSKGDADVLRIVAPLLAQTIRSQGLARELARSRGAAIAGIEEERRRLRRDLHDGLGPTLTGVAFAADAARNQLAVSPETAEQLLAQLRDDTADAIAEVRRLVDGLRPPALDELGLVGAVTAWASRLHGATGAPIDTTFDVPDTLPTLTAAQEVAAYRIIVEALTNVARHSGSADARVVITFTTTQIELTISDSGSGGSWKPGVGLTSMRERAEQVGGTLKVSSTKAGGVVRARLPLSSSGVTKQ